MISGRKHLKINTERVLGYTLTWLSGFLRLHSLGINGSECTWVKRRVTRCMISSFDSTSLAIRDGSLIPWYSYPRKIRSWRDWMRHSRKEYATNSPVMPLSFKARIRFIRSGMSLRFSFGNSSTRKIRTCGRRCLVRAALVCNFRCRIIGRATWKGYSVSSTPDRSP